MPASSRASSSSRPAGPTNGAPSTSSWSPGCSPTSMTSAPSLPSPNTVWVAVRNRSQPWHDAAASRNALRSSLSGIHGRAVGKAMVRSYPLQVLDDLDARGEVGDVHGGAVRSEGDVEWRAADEEELRRPGVGD